MDSGDYISDKDNFMKNDENRSSSSEDGHGIASSDKAGEVKPDHIHFNLETLLRKVVDMYTARAESKGVKFVCFVSPRIPYLVIGDPVRLMQVFSNLLDNAFKFTSSGKVILYIDLIEDIQESVIIRFSIKDTGRGIPAERQTYIFDWFTSSDGTETGEHGKASHGLAMSRHLVALMTGDIGFESEEGRGSTFWFTATFEKQKKMAAKTGKTRTPSALPIRFNPEDINVLVVEDSTDNRNSVCQHLSNFGFKVDSAESGKDAVDAYKKKVYNIILMDMQMPEMEGYATTREIREIEGRIKAGKDPKEPDQNGRIPIIAVTAASMKDDREKCIAAGSDDHISKPLKSSRLISMIEKWISQIKE